mgnify:FL=1
MIVRSSGSLFLRVIEPSVIQSVDFGSLLKLIAL